MAVVETDWERECEGVEAEAPEPEPEPEATGVEAASAWSESVRWWTAAGGIADKEIKGLKKDYKFLFRKDYTTKNRRQTYTKNIQIKFTVIGWLHINVIVVLHCGLEVAFALPHTIIDIIDKNCRCI